MREIEFALAILFFLFLMSIEPVLSKGKIRLTLEKAVEIALEKNEDILVARTDLRGMKERRKEARSGFFPTLSASGRLTHNIKLPVFYLEFMGRRQEVKMGLINNYSTNLTLIQPLYAGGKIRTSVEIANIAIGMVNEEYKNTRQSIALQVKQGFYSVLLMREIVKVNQQALEQAENHYENLKNLYERGMVSEFDLIRAEVQVSNFKPQLLQSENNLKIAKNNLRRILGLELDSEIEFEGDLTYMPFELKSTEQMLEEALQRRPDIKQLYLQKQIMQKNVRMEKSDYLPTLILAGNYQYQAQTDETFPATEDFISSINASLQLDFPIFNGFKTPARVQQAMVEVRKINYIIERALKSIELEIRGLVMKIDEALKRIESTSKTVQQAEKGYDIALVRYKNGLSTQLEVMDSQLALNRAKLAYLEAVYDYNTSLAALHKALGRI